MKLIRKTFVVLLASAGIRIDTINDNRIDTILFIIAGYSAHFFISQYVSFKLALIYFIILFLIRYVILFVGFLKNGYVYNLINRIGEEKAWEKYEMVTGFLFFQRGLSFGLLTESTKWSIISVFDEKIMHLNTDDLLLVKYICIGLGFIAVILGLWVNTAATFVIGIDTYYYKDLFLRKAILDFKVAGPYKYFANPMYGVGQLSGYGAALLVGSIPGILATLLNQITMYVFYYAIEKPHIEAIFGKVKIKSELVTFT